MKSLQLSAGTIEYLDSGGSGPVLVFLHGAMKDALVWREVVAGLPGFRCVRPTMPLGSHRIAMEPDADLSIAGLARLVAEFLHALDLHDVTLVQNHWGAAQTMLAEGCADRITRLVLCACEAFDNYPPGRAGRAFAAAARVPGALALAGRALRNPGLRARYAAADPTALQPIPSDLAERWLLPFATDEGVRRDIGKILGQRYTAEDKRRWAEATGFPGPVLVVWAREDQLMPQEHGPRLAAGFPKARLVRADHSRTCVPLDRPDLLIRELTALSSA
ncbi:alpha/beta hydrolase [Nocardia huaxiensis]|uniref:Alpha/beta hydrolase n=2 Tax=Nocardia huaxiensis TaxID=2755382 RepID=A0A7D6VG85_9NOCA|nr:alpha/beta hydrolase [Nocardia huaxiensis]